MYRCVQKKNSDSLLYFMDFRGGRRLCPGKELGLVEISMFLYYFVMYYKFILCIWGRGIIRAYTNYRV
jgi:hypothetical protein